MRKFYREPNEVSFNPLKYYGVSNLKFWEPSKYRLNRVWGVWHDLLWCGTIFDIIEIHNVNGEMDNIYASDRVYGYLKRAVVFR